MRGKAGSVPFWPGGLEDPSSGLPDDLEDELEVGGKGIRTIPPGFTRGLRLPGEGEDEAGLDGLDNIQKHLAVGRGNAVSKPSQNRARLSYGFYLAVILAIGIRGSTSRRKLGNR